MRVAQCVLAVNLKGVFMRLGLVKYCQLYRAAHGMK